MVTCSLNGGAGERRPTNNIPSNSKVNSYNNHQTGVVRKSDNADKQNGASPNIADEATPMVTK